MNKDYHYMISTIPKYEQDSEIIKEILRVISLKTLKIQSKINDFKKQLLVSTATWALDIYEKELGLPTNPLLPYNKRRAIILSKLRGQGKVNDLMIKSIIHSYTNVEPSVEFNGNLLIDIIISNKLNGSIEQIIKTINNIKPSHLPLFVSLDFKSKNKNDIQYSLTTLSANDTTIYPYQPDELVTNLNLYLSAGYNSNINDITIYPKRRD